MKCNLCKGKNLYIARTSPILKYGCRDCDKKAEILKSKGLTINEIKKVLQR